MIEFIAQNIYHLMEFEINPMPGPRSVCRRRNERKTQGDHSSL